LISKLNNRSSIDLLIFPVGPFPNFNPLIHNGFNFFMTFCCSFLYLLYFFLFKFVKSSRLPHKLQGCIHIAVCSLNVANSKGLALFLIPWKSFPFWLLLHVDGISAISFRRKRRASLKTEKYQNKKQLEHSLKIRLAILIHCKLVNSITFFSFFRSG